MIRSLSTAVENNSLEKLPYYHFGNNRCKVKKHLHVELMETKKEANLNLTNQNHKQIKQEKLTWHCKYSINSRSFPSEPKTYLLPGAKKKLNNLSRIFELINRTIIIS